MNSWNLVGSNITGNNEEQLGSYVALSSDGTTMAIGGRTNVVYVYNININNGSRTLIGTISGYGITVALSLNGSRLAIGNPTPSYNGSVTIFDYNSTNNTWNQVGSTLYGDGTTNNFGSSISLSNLGTTIIIGESFSNNFGGAAQIYTFTYDWINKGQPILGIIPNSQLGKSVSISDDILGNDGNVIAVSSNDSVDVYIYSSSIWNKIGTSIRNNGNVSLSNDGTIIAIGSPTSNASNGSVTVYKYTSEWLQIGGVINGSLNSYLGSSVSLSDDGTILAIGANEFGNGYGKFCVYEFYNNNWIQMGSTIYGNTIQSNFGNAISMASYGRFLAVGASIGTNNAGYVQLYNFLFKTHSWYWLDISGTFIDPTYQITDLSFNGYFSVNNDINVVDALYNIAYKPTPNQNILLMTSPAFPVPQQDNLYQSGWQSFDSSGLYIDMTVDPSFLGIANIPGFVDLVYNNYYTYSLFNLAGDTLNNSVLTNTQIRLIYGTQPSFSLALNYNIRPMVPNEDPSCFIEGTTILCLDANLAEVYVPIKDIRRGMLVKTYLHGFRRVDLIGKRNMVNTHHWNLAVHRLPKSEANGLTEDLYVTGGHSILVDSISDADLATYKELVVFETGEPIKIDDKYLLLAGISDQFVKIENEESYVYYHLCLESDGDDDRRFGIWANGCLTETVSRNQFLMHNYEIL